MNTAKRTLVSAVIAAAALLFCSSTHANTLDGGPHGPKSRMNILRTEPVDVFFMPTANPVNALQRVVRAGANGQFLVQVTAANGALMMEGIYNDLKCLVPNGPFTYYYGNGRVSARGSFVMGVKTGVWLRFDAQGNALAEHVYTGLSWEQTLSRSEQSSMASKKH